MYPKYPKTTQHGAPPSRAPGSILQRRGLRRSPLATRVAVLDLASSLAAAAQPGVGPLAGAVAAAAGAARAGVHVVRCAPSSATSHNVRCQARAEARRGGRRALLDNTALAHWEYDKRGFEGCCRARRALQRSHASRYLTLHVETRATEVRSLAALVTAHTSCSLSLSSISLRLSLSHSLVPPTRARISGSALCHAFLRNLASDHADACGRLR